jgi:hypothetical protein
VKVGVLARRAAKTAHSTTRAEPVHAANRSAVVVTIAVLVTVAVLGYVAGHDRARAAPEASRRTISVAGVLLAYPSDWQPTHTALAISGLSLAHSVALAPGGDGAHAGLLAGQLPGGEPGPLPRQFLTRMRSLPSTEVVNLVDTQGYRYGPLRIDGFERTLSLYAIPNSKGDPTVLACYAPSASSVEMRACEGIVATLMLAEQSSSYDLVPEPDYARRLSASIGALEGQRAMLRREMSAGATPHTVQKLAARLAAGFAAEAVSLSLLEPPSVTGQAQATLSRAILRARDAYDALSAAISAESPSRLAGAQKRVGEAEASVNAALESFALLGYGA